jgi:hypothetical protein
MYPSSYATSCSVSQEKPYKRLRGWSGTSFSFSAQMRLKKSVSGRAIQSAASRHK